MTTTLVDADGLMYIAGFGVEKTHYQVGYETAEGDWVEAFFGSVREIKDFFAENEGFEEIHRESWVEVGELSHALQIAKAKMSEIRDKFGPKMEVYVRGDAQKNFRDELATIAPYKGNRTSHKPTYYEQIRQYLVDEWGAYKVEDQEVDDEIGCRLTELEALGERVVIASPDKDLDQFPGQHWSYKANIAYDVEPIEAYHFFYQQALEGDSADNIKGCWKCGAKAASDILAAVVHMDEAEIWQAVVNTYEESMGLNKCPYAGMPAEAVALENAQLVYMRRVRGEIWMPPGVPNLQEVREVSLDD